MPIRFFCPECQAKLTVSRRYAGHRGRCPTCKTKVQVPDIFVPEQAIAKQLDSQGTRQAQPGETVADEALAASSNLADSEREKNAAGDSLAADDAERVAAITSQPVRSRWLDSELVELVHVPRWVVYLQGALLGIVATSFFVFGLAVGNHTKVVSQRDQPATECWVEGSVYYDVDNYRAADLGAVVMWLPIDRKPSTRPPANTLRPGSFEPLDNPSIETIQQMGGAVVRANQDGSFQTTLEGQRSYWLLVISKNKQTAVDEISKQTRAELGAYFFPVEDLLGDRAFFWSKVKLSGTKKKLDAIVF